MLELGRYEAAMIQSTTPPCSPRCRRRGWLILGYVEDTENRFLALSGNRAPHIWMVYDLSLFSRQDLQFGASPNFRQPSMLVMNDPNCWWL
jgi:hypothetical protein